MVTRGLRLMVIVCVAMVAGCAAPSRDPVPREMVNEAVIPGFPEARFAQDMNDPAFLERLSTLVEERRKAHGIEPGQRLPDAAFLALSGGGQDGAYGAGILCAWTERGDRPEFTVVTGISTGALIGPFAFLGPEYDDVLRKSYTDTVDKDIYTKKGMIRGFLGDSMLNSAPLEKTIASTFGQHELDLVAQEYGKGRLLLIATTNIDTGQSVIWDIGAIARSGKPGALELVRKILLASASIPVAFPPVLFDVEVRGKTYQEMHVDGGAAAQVFIYPASFNLRKVSEEYGIDVHRTAYVIRNSRLVPRWAAPEMKTMSIAGRTIDSLICTQGVGDLYRIYAETVRDGLGFNLAFIPADFDLKPKTMFDPEYMRPLFQLGYDATMNGTVWQNGPPGFVDIKLEDVD